MAVAQAFSTGQVGRLSVPTIDKLRGRFSDEERERWEQRGVWAQQVLTPI